MFFSAIGLIQVKELSNQWHCSICIDNNTEGNTSGYIFYLQKSLIYNILHIVDACVCVYICGVFNHYLRHLKTHRKTERTE